MLWGVEVKYKLLKRKAYFRSELLGSSVLTAHLIIIVFHFSSTSSSVHTI